MNCHPAGNHPLQGDDSHMHIMTYNAEKMNRRVCFENVPTVIQPTQCPGTHTPPGNPKWHCLREDMKDGFPGKDAESLALQIMDYIRNGHKNKEQLLET